MLRTLAPAGLRLICAVLMLVGLAVASPEASANHRTVIVNGMLLGPQDMAYLDSLNGAEVPNGNYWLDLQSGIWGYAGDPTPRGQLGGGAASGGSGGGYDEGTYGGQLDRGPFGTYMSDGECSFVNGVPVGNC